MTEFTTMSEGMSREQKLELAIETIVGVFAMVKTGQLTFETAMTEAIVVGRLALAIDSNPSARSENSR